METLKDRLRELFFLEKEDSSHEECYATAYAYYQKKRYLEACPLFQLLVQQKPGEAKYWKGFAASLQMLKEFEKALSCYAAARALLPDDLKVSLHAADCYFALGKIHEALETLKGVESRAKERHEHALLSHIQLLKEQWKSKKKGKSV